MTTKWQEKNPQKARECRRDWYEKNRESEISKAAVRRKEAVRRNVTFVRTFKTDKPCLDCGNVYIPEVMDFDHISDDKVMTICLMARRAVSLDTLKAEIAKCELVCANCHRVRTFKRAGDARREVGFQTQLSGIDT